jgi:hypothetical protein
MGDVAVRGSATAFASPPNTATTESEVPMTVPAETVTIALSGEATAVMVTAKPEAALPASAPPPTNKGRAETSPIVADASAPETAGEISPERGTPTALPCTPRIVPWTAARPVPAALVALLPETVMPRRAAPALEVAPAPGKVSETLVERMAAVAATDAPVGKTICPISSWSVPTAEEAAALEIVRRTSGVGTPADVMAKIPKTCTPRTTAPPAAVETAPIVAPLTLAASKPAVPAVAAPGMTRD